MDPGGHVQRMERAGVVVHGTVLRQRAPLWARLPVHRLPRWVPRWLRRSANATADIQVIQAWKARPHSVVSVNLGSGQCCDCTFGTRAFTVGEEVILFGRVKDGVPRVGASLCNPPLRRSQVDRALVDYGPGTTDLDARPRPIGRWLGRAGVLLVLLWLGRRWFKMGRRQGRAGT